MNKDKLYEKIISMVPVKSDEKKDFREVVSENLNQYLQFVKQLNNSVRESTAPLRVSTVVCAIQHTPQLKTNLTAIKR